MGKIKELLKAISKGCSHDSKSYLGPLPIAPEETLARFLFQSRHFSKTGIKQAAFLPARNMETSVFRKTRLGQAYSATKKVIEDERKMTIKAVALITAGDVEKEEHLVVKPEESDHRWHANIIGWPENKHEQKQLALILANCATKE